VNKKAKKMEPSSDPVFHLMSELTDALADLSISIEKWRAELESCALDADGVSAGLARQALESISGKR
jgi:hypothetical protein